VFRGGFAGSSRVPRCSGAAAGGPESGRAGDAAVVDRRIVDDVAGLGNALGVEVGSWCITEAWGASRAELGSVGRLLDRR
jgi:hypothetical protein